jgi:hypothetical protein
LGLGNGLKTSEAATAEIKPDLEQLADHRPLIEIAARFVKVRKWKSQKRCQCKPL